ncbi:hypothetical protein [Serinibacter salmoneus]|uniref:Uncharacterized protein n=1 Tax=Serinibacter salmoneus TaxID=556530 RepID=A0A2A9D2K4_9MICO|nr:hypothetical protein [Serinibacter salmoneus]PFG20090.1 hypothetical protein ATL40_1673 [Serinibacter salmoneus]
MVNGTRSAQQVLRAVRKNARRLGLSVEELPRRGKGSHSIWVVLDAEGNEVGRIGLTGHAGQQSQIVTRSNEKALLDLFGEGWLDK